MRLRTFLVETYHQQPHRETGVPPHRRWETNDFLPRLPDSLDQLDLLLLTVASHVAGMAFIFKGSAISTPRSRPTSARTSSSATTRATWPSCGSTLAIVPCVGRSTPELAGETIGLKDIIRARNQRRRELRTTLAEREATVEALLRLRRGEELRPEPEPLFPEPEAASSTPPARPRLKSYFNE
jgi:putative transposase